MAFGVKFWGVRGSIPVSSPRHVKYGGNTSCLEMIAGDRRFILDAGTGIRALGDEFARRGAREIDLLLTHTHWDHISGFPFFAPAYDPACTIHIRAGHLMGNGSIREVLSSQMAHPMFPVPLEAMRARLVFEDFAAGDSFDLYPEVDIRTAPLSHPNRATAYRIEFAGRSICYVTDTEHVPGRLDERIAALVQGADLMIYDSTYTEEEFVAKTGWGHSTWNEGVRLCRAAGVGRLALFHHEPDHDDAFMERLEAEAKAAWPGCFAARDGMTVTIA